jgi:hypothetical protein
MSLGVRVFHSQCSMYRCWYHTLSRLQQLHNVATTAGTVSMHNCISTTLPAGLYLFGQKSHFSVAFHQQTHACLWFHAPRGTDKAQSEITSAQAQATVHSPHQPLSLLPLPSPHHPPLFPTAGLTPALSSAACSLVLPQTRWQSWRSCH